jgi:hypothetical protein
MLRRATVRSAICVAPSRSAARSISLCIASNALSLCASLKALRLARARQGRKPLNVPARAHDTARNASQQFNEWSRQLGGVQAPRDVRNGSRAHAQAWHLRPHCRLIAAGMVCSWPWRSRKRPTRSAMRWAKPVGSVPADAFTPRKDNAPPDRSTYTRRGTACGSAGWIKRAAEALDQRHRAGAGAPKSLPPCGLASTQVSATR